MVNYENVCYICMIKEILLYIYNFFNKRKIMSSLVEKQVKDIKGNLYIKM